MKDTQHTFWEEFLFYRPLRYIILCGSILLVVWLFLTVPKWAASFKDEVAYSEDLKNHSPAYADVVSVEPVEEHFSVQENITNLYCKCTLVDGNTIWVQFTTPEYVDFIDSNYSEVDTAEEIRFDAPLRMHGRAEIVGRVIKAFAGNNNLILIVDSVDIS